MSRRVGMVHAGCSNAQVFKKLIAEIMPDTEVIHLVDEGIPAMSAKPLHKDVVRRLGRLATSAKESGAEMVLLTCTAFGRLAEEVQEIAHVPVISVLELVIDEAAKLGGRVGILATHPGTLESAAEMLREQAANKRVEVMPMLCKGGFDALKVEDWDTHDRLVLTCLKELIEKTDVVVIPQPSIERVVKQLTHPARKVRIFPSARFSVERFKEKLDSSNTPA